MAVFSLGVVLYEMLALNRHPFDAESWNGVIDRIVDGRFPMLVARGYSDELKHLCYKMLTPSLSKRPSTGNIWSMAVVRDKARLVGLEEIPAGDASGREGSWEGSWEGDFYDDEAEAAKRKKDKEKYVDNIRTSAMTDKWKKAGQQDGIDALLSLAGGGPMKEMPIAPPRHKAASGINRASVTDTALPPPPSARDTGIFTPQFAMRRANPLKARMAAQQQQQGATATKPKKKAQQGKALTARRVQPLNPKNPKGVGAAGGLCYFGKMEL